MKLSPLPVLLACLALTGCPGSADSKDPNVASPLTEIELQAVKGELQKNATWSPADKVKYAKSKLGKEHVLQLKTLLYWYAATPSCNYFSLDPSTGSAGMGSATPDECKDHAPKK